MIFGNDYLLNFDRGNQVLTKKQLHKNILPVKYGSNNNSNGEQIEGAMHTHLPETGDLITSTDICTLMLYQKFAGWKSYVVVSEKYMNIWNCESNSLAVVPKHVIDKIDADQKKQKKTGVNEPPPRHFRQVQGTLPV